MSTNVGAPAPLYARVLRLRHLRPGGVVCFILFEMMIAVAVLLALAELVNWWAVPVLPVAVAVMVKVNDLLVGLNRAASGGGEPERREPVDYFGNGARGGHGWASGSGAAGMYGSGADPAGRVPGGRSPVDQRGDRTGNARAFEFARRDGARRNDDPGRAGRRFGPAGAEGARSSAGQSRSGGPVNTGGVGRASVPGMRSGPVRGRGPDRNAGDAGSGEPSFGDRNSGVSQTRAAVGTTYHSRAYRESAPRRRIREARRPIGVIKLSLPPRDGGVLPKTGAGGSNRSVDAGD